MQESWGKKKARNNTQSSDQKRVNGKIVKE